MPDMSKPRLERVSAERFNLAVPFLKDGQIVYDPAMDTPERWGGAAPPGLAA